MDKKLLTPDELAERLGVCRRTILNWAGLGRIPSVRLTDQTVRFDLEAVLTAARRRRPDVLPFPTPAA